MQKVSAITCDRPTEDNSMQIAVITPLFGVLAVLARYLQGMKTAWGYDDWAMVLTVVGIADSHCTDRILIGLRLQLFP